jgi:hypothetical protein
MPADDFVFISQLIQVLTASDLISEFQRNEFKPKKIKKALGYSSSSLRRELFYVSRILKIFLNNPHFE